MANTVRGDRVMALQLGVNMEIVQAIMNDAVNAEKEILALKAQRDDLLAVLRDVIGWVPGREHWHTDSPMKSVERARALIAKHKCGAARATEGSV